MRQEVSCLKNGRANGEPKRMKRAKTNWVTIRAKSVRRAPAKLVGSRGSQSRKTRTTRALRSCLKQVRPLRQPGLKAQKMPPTTLSGPCIHTTNMGVSMICRQQEVRIERKPHNFAQNGN